jgi:hypothetical protein
MRHVLDAICHMRINVRESPRSVRVRLRHAERERKLRESYKSAESLQEVAGNLQGLQSCFTFEEI